jgi:hypothetical protein
MSPGGFFSAGTALCVGPGTDAKPGPAELATADGTGASELPVPLGGALDTSARVGPGTAEGAGGLVFAPLQAVMLSTAAAAKKAMGLVISRK